MITKEQIENAANDAYGRYSEAETSGFIVGAEWAAEQMQAEVERLNSLLIGSANEAGRLSAENARLNLENAAIAGERDAALMEVGMAIADMENGAQKTALERLKKLLEK